MRNAKYWIVLVVVLLLTGIMLLIAPVKTQQWWYPFVGFSMDDTFTAGPIGFSSNVREDSPIWKNVPDMNKSFARMTYVMTRGKPDADIAWLMMDAEWPDKVALSAGVDPNKSESAISRAITQSGFVYDRISRNNLQQATIKQNHLQIGAMRYKALLVDDVRKASPELLKRIKQVVENGIPVLWLGELPVRAVGWKDHERRDQQVADWRETIAPALIRISNTEELIKVLRDNKVAAPLIELTSKSGDLRTQRRKSGDTTFILIFNDSKQTVSIPLIENYGSKNIHLLNPEDGIIKNVSESNIILQIPAGRTRILQIGSTSPDWQKEEWQTPSMAYRPFIRWWWPGNAVEPMELRKELKGLHAAGFGGVEIQTLTFGLGKDVLQEHAENIYGVGTKKWLENINEVFDEARSLGIQVDLTMGSGWPTGAPFITEYPEQQLLRSVSDLTSGEMIHKLPPLKTPLYAKVTNWIVHDVLGEFDTSAKLFAVLAVQENDAGLLVQFEDLSSMVVGNRVEWKVPPGQWKLVVLYQNATHHNVMASAFPGAELHLASHQVNVIDHLDERGMLEYIHKLGDPWLKELSPNKPSAFFIDSFELIGDLPWSVRFREAFEKQHGYDITPYLLLVFRQYGESKYFNMLVSPKPAYHAEGVMGERIREDYEATREVLFRESFVLPLKQWLGNQRIALRMQAHGGFGDYLDNYQLADIPESEALFAGGSFDFLKLAASAGHVAGRNIITLESFISASYDPDCLSEDDFYYLAGNAYAAGINRLIYHGYAYRLSMNSW